MNPQEISNPSPSSIRHLLLVTDPAGQRVVSLDVGTYSLGRDPRNSIVLHARTVSRQHAVLLRVTVPDSDDCLFRIVDGSFNGQRSTNGIFVNGDRRFAHNLEHGDVIEFSEEAKAHYYAITNLDSHNLQALCQSQDPGRLLQDPDGSYTGVSHHGNTAARNSDTALAHLASFPELIPNPIVELSSQGQITYLNPAAHRVFPQLRQSGLTHPALTGLPELVLSTDATTLTRSVQIGTQIYEQAVHHMAESDLIRIFMTDITERKRVEAELKRRDQMFQAVATASTSLLAEINFETSINQALAVLGRAAAVDRIAIYENHPHPHTGELCMSLRFEWHRSSQLALCSQEILHNQSYAHYGLQGWSQQLNQGKAIYGSGSQLTMSEKSWLERNHAKSVLMVPIWQGQRCWGHVDFQDCQTDRQWSTHEEAVLFTMAASLSRSLHRQQTDEMMRYRTTHDLLTTLPNRLFFDQELAAALKTSYQNQGTIAVLFLDLDGFKDINDSLGHAIGDLLLKAVAQRLQDHLEGDYCLARWGGDKFIFLLTQVQSNHAVEQFAGQCFDALQAPFSLAQMDLHISASVGISIHHARTNRSSLDSEVLIREADTALYYAKSQGRNRYQIYKSALVVKTPELLLLEQQLYHAVNNNELRLAYQPQVDLCTGALVGMEALVRWQHPKRGLISPGVFVPIAEESGLIVNIGEWVLREACRQNQQWQMMGLPPLRMGVNLSPQQFRQSRLVETIAQVLAKTDLSPQYLELEITESAVIEDIDFTQSLMRELNRLGIQLSIDDFGTGHSSLSRLQFLPLDTLKIDQSFVRDWSHNSKASHIIAAIVALGRSLGLTLIAEGVEQQEQLEFLRSIHCDYAQGFFFHRPLSADQFTLLLRRESRRLCPEKANSA